MLNCGHHFMSPATCRNADSLAVDAASSPFVPFSVVRPPPPIIFHDRFEQFVFPDSALSTCFASWCSAADNVNSACAVGKRSCSRGRRLCLHRFISQCADANVELTCPCLCCSCALFLRCRNGFVGVCAVLWQWRACSVHSCCCGYVAMGCCS